MPVKYDWILFLVYENLTEIKTVAFSCKVTPCSLHLVYRTTVCLCVRDTSCASQPKPETLISYCFNKVSDASILPTAL